MGDKCICSETEICGFHAYLVLAIAFGKPIPDWMKEENKD